MTGTALTALWELLMEQGISALPDVFIKKARVTAF